MKTGISIFAVGLALAPALTFAKNISQHTKDVATSMVKVESVNREIACGKNAPNLSVCVGDEADSVVVPDTVGTVQQTFITATSACGIDEDGGQMLEASQHRKHSRERPTYRDGYSCLAKISRSGFCALQRASDLWTRNENGLPEVPSPRLGYVRPTSVQSATRAPDSRDRPAKQNA